MKNINIKNKRLIVFFTIILIITIIVLVFNRYKNNKPNIVNDQLPPSTPVSNIPVQISPLAKTVVSDNGEVYGINRKNGNLTRFKTDKEEIIYRGKVSDYDIKGEVALVLDDSNLAEIVVLNLKTNSQNKLSFLSLSPIISISLSEDEKTIYFLAEFNITQKISSINTVTIDGLNHKKNGETSAQSLKYLKNDTLLLFEDTHAQDKSILYFYNVSQNKILFSKFANTFLISPDGKNIALKTTNGIEIVNTIDFQSGSIKTLSSNRYVWKNNNNVVLFRNSDQGVSFAPLNINPLRLLPFKVFAQNTSMLAAFGFIEDKLYWQNYNEDIISTILEP